MRRRIRQIIFVCSVIKDNALVSKMVESLTIEDSCILFEKEFGVKPQTVFGPFYQKKSSVLEKNVDIKFKIGPNKQGIYNGWFVTVMPLENPPDSGYLLYNKQADGHKELKPLPTVVKMKDIKDMK